jgi:hypothetical protein
VAPLCRLPPRDWRAATSQIDSAGAFKPLRPNAVQPDTSIHFECEANCSARRVRRSNRRSRVPVARREFVLDVAVTTARTHRRTCRRRPAFVGRPNSCACRWSRSTASQAARGGLNFESRGVDADPLGINIVPVSSFDESRRSRRSKREQDAVPDNRHRVGAPGGAGPLARAPRPGTLHPPQERTWVPESWRGPAFAKPGGELRTLPGASRRFNPPLEGRKNVSPKEGTERRASPGPETTKNGGCGASSDCRMEGAQGGALQPGLQKEKTNPFDSAQQRQGPRRNPGRSGLAPARATRSRRPRAARTGAAIQDGPGVSSPPRTARSSAPCRRPSPPRSCRSP